MKLFISYARNDLERVRQIVELLRAAGHEPWFDEALLPGQAWQEQLAVAIRSNDAFVYLLTSDSVASEWCQWEFSTAIDLGKPIIPVQLDPDLDLPDPLGRFQCADFTPGAGSPGFALATARLIGGLQQIAVTIDREDVPRTLRRKSGVPAYSGFIEKVVYDPVNRAMAVEFKSGQIYQYLDVPQKVFQDFMKSPSLGDFFHRNIRDAYRYHRTESL